MGIAETIIVSVLGSTAISGLIQFLISRHDSKKNVQSKLMTLEKDGLRTQLLILILLKPEDTHEILTLAEHYFSPPLSGDWYLTPIFNRWCIDNGIGEPAWFNKEA